MVPADGPDDPHNLPRARERTLRVPGATLLVAQVDALRDDGSPPIVVLHGGPSANHEYLRPQLDAVGDHRRRVVYYDQRGGGRSRLDAGTAQPGYLDHVADLEALRQDLDLPALDLVGYSWGGLLATLYTVAHPERVARLALISPAPLDARSRDEMQARLAAARHRPDIVALAATLDPHNRRHRFALAVAGYFVDPRQALAMTPFLVTQRASDSTWASLGDYNLHAAVRALPTRPALVVHGHEDPIPIASARQTAADLDARLVEIPRCGHVPFVEGPDLLFPALAAFFR